MREQRRRLARLHLAEAMAGGAARARSPPARRCTATATSAARRPTSILPAGGGGRDPGADAPSSSRPSSRSARRRSARPNTARSRPRRSTPTPLAKPDDGVAMPTPRQRYEQREGELRHARAAHDPADRLPDARRRPRPPSPGSRRATPFDAVAAERNVGASDLELGTFAKIEMLDPAVADAAFALQEGAVSGPVEGRFGTVLVRVDQGPARGGAALRGGRGRGEAASSRRSAPAAEIDARPRRDRGPARRRPAARRDRPGEGPARSSRCRPIERSRPGQGRPARSRTCPSATALLQRRLRVGCRRRQRGPAHAATAAMSGST